MSVFIQNISARAGDDEVYKFNVKDDDGNAIDLSDYTAFSGKIRANVDSASSLGNFTYLSGQSDLETGLLAFLIPNTLTLTLPEICYYDLQFTDFSSYIRTFAQGRIAVEKQITY